MIELGIFEWQQSYSPEKGFRWDKKSDGDDNVNVIEITAGWY